MLGLFLEVDSLLFGEVGAGMLLCKCGFCRVCGFGVVFWCICFVF